MNRTFLLISLATVGFVPSLLSAQTHPAPTAAATSTTPQAVSAKVATIALQQVGGATNEAQAFIATLRKKYEPRANELRSRASELDTLKKQLQSLPPNASEEDRGKRERDIATRERKLQTDAQDLQQEQQAEFQDSFVKILQKVDRTAVKYATDNGFTLLVNTEATESEIPTVIWGSAQGDISQAVLTAYNTASGIAAPPPSAPTPAVHHSALPATPRK